jgi:DNA-binding NarL/FixJ family response regulator
MNDGGQLMNMGHVHAAPRTLGIVVVDDHATFAELLTGALEREPDLVSLGTAATVADGVQLCLALRPDLVVMDYHLPDGTGLAAAARILDQAPETRIVMLTGNPTPEALEEAAAIGICGFLPKDGSLATVLDTLRHARKGCMTVHPVLLAESRNRSRRTAAPPVVLTQREAAVLRLLARGSDVRTSAKVLGISPNTCRGYVKAILAKLGAHSQLEAVVKATGLGLLHPSGDDA